MSGRLQLPDYETIRQAVAARRDWAERALTDWVRYDSTLGLEGPAQEHAAALFEQVGLRARLAPIDVDRIRGFPGFSPVDWSYAGRPNVIGEHDPEAVSGRSLIINGHVDVVSPEPRALWTTPPFEPVVIEDGPDGETWVRGRGAGDMKGGTLAALWALAALQELELAPAARLIAQSVIEEECTGNGTLALCAAGLDAEGCLIPEPFDETLLLRQIGVLWFQVRLLGRTTHVLGAARGVNAIEKSWIIIEALRQLESELNAPTAIPAGYRHVEHPLNLNIGVIRGGDWASTVAGECVVHCRLGFFPGVSCAEMKRRVERCVAQAAERDPWLRSQPPQVEYLGFQAEGCELAEDDHFLQAIAVAHERWRGSPPARLAATCTTDARFFNLNAGLPATCYGPRAIDIHGVDEMVSLDSMARVAQVIVTLIARWCGVRPRRQRS